ncbi:PAS domain-containing protein [Halobaculum sp. WSA2]|uniref:histidine kinase n=1 Tax=Halobaculum saliterrae TaxID=2073113 RepID=A0A6B0SPS9_9EURY|nr:ATP-binding protein [Halobaculum saliterrae]MXR40918.1 PAS domain-containing protein [Halobaculum saliterrae]
MTASPPVVLYVDPDPGSCDRAAEELHRALPEATVVTVGSADAALGVVADARRVDGVVSAYDLPDGHGLDLLAEVRDERGETPFVLFPDEGSEAIASDAITAGVSEYVREDRRDPYRTLARRVRETIDRHSNDRHTDDSTAGADHVRRRLLVERTDQPMAVVEDGRHRLVNEAYVDLVGLPRDRVLGSTDDDLFPAAVADDLRDHGEGALADGERREHRIETDLGGEERVLDVVHFPEAEDTRNDRSMVGRTIRDVTDRVEREELLRTERDRLEALSSAVAHDARNAIQVIRGRAMLIEESLPPDADEPLEHLSGLELGVDRMDHLVSSLESLRGVSDPVTDPVPVSIAEAARDAWATVDAPDARLRVRADQTMLGDPARIRTLLENLFRNSVEHAPSTDGRRAEPAADPIDCGDPSGTDAGHDSNPTGEGAPPSVTVTVDALDGVRGFAVSDDGDGIPDSEREQVLEFGYSLDGGTGLGLGIVSGIVDAHGWSVDLADSDPGGARFEFRQETLDSFVS